MSLASFLPTQGTAQKNEASYLHCDEQTLEEYCLGILEKKRIRAVEEHLLICEDCRTALTAQAEFIQCLKAALRTQRIPRDFDYLQKSA